MAETELLPCPCRFCGFAVDRDHAQVVSTRVGQRYAVVVCGRCGAQGPRPDLPAHWSDESGMLDTRCTDDAIAAWNRRAVPEQEGVVAGLGEPKASEHLSSERRRGLEEALTKVIDDWCDEYRIFDHNARWKLRHRLRALSPSSEGGEEKTDPAREEMARALEELTAHAKIIGRLQPSNGSHWEKYMKFGAAITQADAALSKHRDHPPAVASGGSRR